MARNIGVSGEEIIDTPAGTALAGTTAGTITPYQVEAGTIKKVVLIASGYENDTTTAQTITYAPAFTNVPVITNNTGLTLTTTATVLTIGAPDSTTTYSGTIGIEGI